MTAACVLGLGACQDNGNPNTPDVSNEEQKYIVSEDSDYKYVKNKGKLTIGIGDQEPFNYKTKGGWVGFDADLAKLFAFSWLETDYEFVLINPEEIQRALSSGLIDCYWNGVIYDGALTQYVSCSTPYLYDKEVIILTEEDYDNTEDIAQLLDKTFSVVEGSHAEAVVKERGLKYVTAETEEEALFAISAGKAQAVVISAITAQSKVGEGTDYPELHISDYMLGEDVFVVLFRKGSGLCAQFDTYFYENREDFVERATNYGIMTELVPEK